MDDVNGVSIIIPCYNEVDCITSTLERLTTVLATINLPSEIVVVDDGSTDGTEHKIDPSRFILVRHQINIGYGAALVSGVRMSKYECLVIIDADGTYPIEEIPTLVAMLRDNADMVVGARTGKRVHIPWERKFAKWTITKLANYVTASKILDLNSGLRAIRRPLWERYESIFPKGFSLTTTITLAALTNNWRVNYHSINYLPRVGRSKIKPVRDTINFAMLILRTTILFDPLRVFIPLSLILFITSIILAIFSIVLYIISLGNDIGPLIAISLFIASLQLLALGGIADLIIRAKR